MIILFVTDNEKRGADLIYNSSDEHVATASLYCELVRPWRSRTRIQSLLRGVVASSVFFGNTGGCSSKLHKVDELLEQAAWKADVEA